MWSRLRNCFLAEQNRWFLWLPVFFAAGIGIYFALLVEPSAWIILGLLEILLVAAWLLRRRPAGLRILFPLLLAVLGFANIQLKTIYLSRLEAPTADRKIYLSGRIDKLDANYRGKPRILLSDMKGFDGKAIAGRYRLTMVQKDPGLKAGDCVEMIAVVSPLFQTGMVGGYQFDRQLFFNGITGAGYIPSDVLPVTCPNPSPRFSDLAAALRQTISRRIEAVLPPDQAAVAVAIVAGNQSKISKPLINAYRDSGLAHFLSISGLHMSMLAGLMFFLVRFVMALVPALSLRYNSKKAAAVLAIFISAVYLVISGAAIPAQRAFVMTFVVLLAVLFERQAISMRTLAWAALIVLVISPQALISASFQMSFAAVTALVAFYEKFAGRLSRFLSGEEVSLGGRVLRGIWAYFLGVIIADLVASLATLPFAIYHFNRIALYTSLTNMAAGPLIGFVIMPFVLVSLLLMPLGLETLPLKLVGCGLSAVNSLTTRVASLPHAAAGVVSMPLWGPLLITFGGLWLCLWRCRWRMWGFAAIAVGFLSILTVSVPDLIVDRDARTVAVRTDDGFYFMPGADRWNKQNWLNKYAAAEYKSRQEITNAVYPSRVAVMRRKGITVDGSRFDLERAGGVSFYLKDGRLRTETVRDSIGYRPWNK